MKERKEGREIGGKEGKKRIRQTVFPAQFCSVSTTPTASPKSLKDSDPTAHVILLPIIPRIQGHSNMIQKKDMESAKSFW